MNLLPHPRELRLTETAPLVWNHVNYVQLPRGLGSGAMAVLDALLDEVEALTCRRPEPGYAPALPGDGAALRLRLDASGGGAEEYELTVSATGIVLAAAEETGLFYGLQTLRQLAASCGPEIPALIIRDRPAIPVRGFYHDVTRGRVPTRESLQRLIDRMAYYKLNQLQLYVEHTFAFRHCSELWAGSDALNAEDIIALVRYGKERGVELVPSLSCFGHCYTLLRCKRFEHLNELDVRASERPFSQIDRMAHYTLDCRSPEALALITSMLDEYLDLFDSGLCNICCDETFDLGKGRNSEVAAAAGTESLYCDFVQQLITHVNRHGKTALFWGDIVGKTPEILKRFSGDFTLLDWDYSPELEYCQAQRYEQRGVPYYVCAGTQAWNTALPRIDAAAANIRKAAVTAARHHAAGMLTTDWGDYGHFNQPVNSIYGMALGAAAGWNPDAAADLKCFENAFEALELGAPESGFCDLLRRINGVGKVDWGGVALLADASDHYGAPEERMQLYFTGIGEDEVARALEELTRLEVEFQHCVAKLHPHHPAQKEALLTGMRGLVLMYRILVLARRPDREQARAAAAELRRFERKYAELWHRVSRPSEYWRIREIFQRTGEFLDTQLQPFAGTEVTR